jgi:hypothetical protein
MKTSTNDNKGYALSLANNAYWCYSSSGDGGTGSYQYSTTPVISTSAAHIFKNSNKNISVRLIGYFYRESTTSDLYASYFLKAYSDSDTEFQIKIHAKDSSGNKTRTLNMAKNGETKDGVAASFLTNGQDTTRTCYGANNASFIYPEAVQKTAEANTKDGTGWFNFRYTQDGSESNDLWEKNIIYVSVPGYDSGIVELSCEVLLPLNRAIQFKVGNTVKTTKTWGFGDVIPTNWFGTAPTKTGYTFSDWQTKDGLTFANFRSRVTSWFGANKYSSFTAGVNLYKSYLKDLPQGTIVFSDEGQYDANKGFLKFDSNKKGLIHDRSTESSQTTGGVSSLSKSVTTGIAVNLNQIIAIPSEPEKYNFVGWSKTTNGSTINSCTPVVATSGATVNTLYAIYETRTFRFTVTIGKDEIVDKTVIVDAGTTISAALKKILGEDFDSSLPGKTFVGFKDSSGTIYGLESQIFTDLNVEAAWADRKYSVYFYKIANDTDGNFDEVSVSEGTEIPEGSYPELTFSSEGLAFSGWYTDKALTSPFDKTTKITANLSLYSKWEKIVYINFYNQAESLGRFQWGGVGQNFALPENGIISLTKESPCDITGLTALKNLSTENSNALLEKNKADYGLENVDDLSNYGLYGKITLNGSSPWVNQEGVSVSSISTESSGEYTLYVNWQPEYVYRTETSNSDGTQKAYLIKYLGKETSVTIPTQVRGTGDKKNEEIDVAGFDCVTKVETETDGEGDEVVKTSYISNLVGEFTVTSDGTVVNTLTTLTKITVPAIKDFDLRTNSLIGWSDKNREDKPILNFEGGDIKVNDGFTDGYIKFYGRHSESINSYCDEHKDIGLSQYHTLQFVIVSKDGTPLETQETAPFECGKYSTLIPVPSFENYQPADDRWYPSREALVSGKNRVNFEDKSSESDSPSRIEDDGTYYAYVYSMNFLLDLEGLQHLSEVCDERYSIKAGTSPSLPENKQLSLLSLPDDFTDRGVTLSKTNTTPVVKIDTTNFDYSEGSLSLSALDKDTDENKPGLVSKSYINSYINQVSGKVKEINGSNGIKAEPESDGSKYTLSLDYSTMDKAKEGGLGVCGIQTGGGLNSTDGYLALLSATKDNLGGVKVPADQELQIDSSGNLTVSQAFYTNRLRGSSYFDIRDHQYTDDTSSLRWYSLGDYTCWSKQRIARSVGGASSNQLNCYDLYTEGVNSIDGVLITGIDDKGNISASDVTLSSCLQTKPKTCTVVKTNSKSSATANGGETALYGFCQPGFSELKPGDYYLLSVFVHTDEEVKVSLGCAYMDNSTWKTQDGKTVQAGKSIGYPAAVTVTPKDNTKEKKTYWTRVAAYGKLPDDYLTKEYSSGYSNTLTDAKIGYCYVTPTKTGQEATVKFLAPSLMRIPKSAVRDWGNKNSLQLGYEISKADHDYRFNWKPAPEDYLHLPEDRDIRNMLSKKVSIVDTARAGDSGYIYLPGNRIMIWGGLQPPVKGATDSWLKLVSDKTIKNFGGTLESDVGQVGIKRKIFDKPLSNLQVFVTHQGAGNLGTLDQTAFRKQTYVATQTQQYVGEAQDTWVDFIVYLGGTDKTYYDQFCQWGRFANYFCIASVVGTIE